LNDVVLGLTIFEGGNRMPQPVYYWVCNNCGWVYDPEKGDVESGIDAGTDFESLPINYTCPRCGCNIDNFERNHHY
jgi:rubredoxin